MPRITAITPQVRHKQRQSVFVDGEFFCGVSDEAALRLGLKAGRDLTAEELNRLRGEEMDIQVREQALRWLDRRAYAREELARRLRQKQFPGEAVTRVLDRLQASGILNDEAFARNWLQEHTRGGQVGFRRLQAELRQRGVSDEVIGRVWEELGAGDEAGSCAELARRQWPKYRALPRDTAQRRLTAFLLRRGFDLEDVLRAVKEVLQAADDFK